MSPLPADGRPVRLVIRHLSIGATSSIEARRLADAIIPALQRALEDPGNVSPRRQGSRATRAADQAAADIAAAVTARLGERAP